jgi:hypothetical protein
MILIDNLNFLTERFPLLWQAIKPLEDEHPEWLHVTEAKNGSPTLIVENEGKPLYLHSSYNPEAEAERFISQFTGVEEYNHVFFFGMGLGYHLKAFMKKYPEMDFTIYEPVPQILYTYLSTHLLTDLPVKNLKNIYVETSTANRPLLLKDFTDFSDGNVLFISLPSYERVFPDLTKSFLNSFQNIVASKRINLQATTVYQRKWTINSIRNFKYLLETPNILSEKNRFQGIPALIVAAGPSLMDEIDNIRYIKENGLAYIFSAGSGLVPLLNNKIYPEAATSYDPNNFDGVYKRVFDEKITSIPLIFGSTVGISLQKYPGMMAHMINSQDTLAPYYLRFKNGREIQTIYDSSTITVVLVQLLKYLGFDPLIFVGQNLAYRGEYRYAGGIPYYNPAVNERWLKGAFLVEAIDGEKVYTNEGFNRMRLELQTLISSYQQGEFINTTKGGAKIEGAIFTPLEELIEKRLKNRVVDPSWFPTSSSCVYDLEYLLEQQKQMDNDYHKLAQNINRFKKAFSSLENLGSWANSDEVQKKITRFDRELKKLIKNKFFIMFIQPSRRVELEMIAKNIDEVRFESDSSKKSEKIIKTFSSFVNSLQSDFDMMAKEYEDFQKIIMEASKASI